MKAYAKLCDETNCIFGNVKVANESFHVSLAFHSPAEVAQLSLIWSFEITPFLKLLTIILKRNLFSLANETGGAKRASAAWESLVIYVFEKFW